MTRDTADLLEQIIVCGRLPRRLTGEVDLARVSDLLKRLDDTNHRVAVLRVLLNHNTMASNDRPIIFGRVRRAKSR